MKHENLTVHDAHEIETFKDYLRQTVAWDNGNPSDFSPIPYGGPSAYLHKRLKAHAAIYQQIYGDKP